MSTLTVSCTVTGEYIPLPCGWYLESLNIRASLDVVAGSLSSLEVVTFSAYPAGSDLGDEAEWPATIGVEVQEVAAAIAARYASALAESPFTFKGGASGMAYLVGKGLAEAARATAASLGKPLEYVAVEPPAPTTTFDYDQSAYPTQEEYEAAQALAEAPWAEYEEWLADTAPLRTWAYNLLGKVGWGA